MTTLVLKQPYADVLEWLGGTQAAVDEALRQYTIQKIQEHVLDLQEKACVWEEKYGCSYDLFAYRTATDESYIQQLDSDPTTRQWEADLLSWEFYAAELKEWHQRLHSILTA